ncbi:hypothetical protein Tco_0896343 [Tanacetum coccineum]
MAPSYDDTRNGNREHNNSRMNTNSELKIGDEFLKILQDNAFNGMDGGYITDHIAKVLENTSFRNHVFSNTRLLEITLWRCQDMVETTITWSEVNDKFFHKYNPLSRTCNRKIPDDLDNGTDYFEFMYWLASKFDNYLEIDKNTKNGLWKFYVNERTKGTIGDLDEYKKPCKKTCSDTFYKPYLHAQDANDVYEVINREYSSIPIPSCCDIDNPDKLCRTEEFTVVRHSIGNDEEFVIVGPNKISTVERTPDSMSCIYHELFNSKDRRWTITRTK